jgi:hypothetical protein
VKTLVTGRMQVLPAKSTKMGTSKKRSHDEAGDVSQLSSSSSPRSSLPNPAKEWKKAKLKTEDLLTLINTRFLHEKDMDL